MWKKLILSHCIVCSFYSNVNAQTITTIAGIGTGASSGDGGPAVSAQVPLPGCGAFDIENNYYFIENAGSPRLRVVNNSGIINTIAGTGVFGYSGDGGLATAAQIKNSFFTVDFSGNIIIADMNNNRLRKVDATTGIITTIAGNGTAGSTGDGGPATAALIRPVDVCADAHGNLFVSEDGGSGGGGNIRRINSSGIISHVASINALGMSFGKGGFLYFGCNLYVFRLDTVTGHIDTVAGTGIATYNGDEIPATDANIKVFDLATDPIGNIYIADWTNSRIRQIDTFGIIHTIAGTGVNGYSGDGGPATAAQIHSPEGVAVDACGSVYIADKTNNRIRKVTMPPVLTIPVISVAVPGESAPIPMGTTVTVTATVSSAGSSYLIRWMNRGIEFATTTVPTVTYTKGPGTDTITARVVSTATYGCYDSTTSAPHYVHEGTVGVKYAPAMATNLRLYPNPAHTQLTIGATEPITSVCITNVLGQVVAAPPFLPQGEVTLPVEHLPKGVYVVRVNGVYIQRFVKE